MDGRRPQLAVIGKFRRRYLVQQHRVLAAQQDDAPVVAQPQHLVRLHERALGVAARHGIRPDVVLQGGEQRRLRLLVIGHADGRHAAFLRNEFGARQVVHAQADGGVAAGRDLLPLVPRVHVRQLGDGLHQHLAAHAERPGERDGALEIPQPADGREFVQQEVYPHRQLPVLRLLPRVCLQTGEQHGEEQRGQEGVGAVLRGQDAEIGAGLLSWQGEVYRAFRSQAVHQRIVEHVQPVAETDHDVAAQILLGVQEQAVGAFGRMPCRQLLYRLVYLLEPVLAEQAEYPAQPPFGQRFWASGCVRVLLHIIKQRREQVELGFAPKIVGLLFT